ncbi:MAG: RluA family pseudouridine synthase [Clostridiales bacterium]|jgi:23S rRNA pseudouridine1911/1915/1917 synthase|nr:RluA family pseudouridine synthase [Clostridiales bacterium]
MIKKEDIRIMFEDNHILVAVKPQNVPSQEDATKAPDTLTLLKEYLKEKYFKTGNVFLGLVHRLDRPTGGVMVFAKTSKAAARLSESIRGGEFDKTYFAVTDGVPKEKRGRLTHYLLKNEETNTVKIVPAGTDGAKKAELTYRLLDATADKTLSLIGINLLTGRGHQARVQIASLGTPIFADHRYGKPRPGLSLALWAAVLKFPHPVSGKMMVFMAYPPEPEPPWNRFDLSKFLTINKDIN